MSEIFKVCKKNRQLPPEQRHPALFKCLAVQMTNSLQSLCLQSMKEFDNYVRSLNEGEAKNQRAGFIMSIKSAVGKIMFYPAYQDIEATILECYDIMLRAATEIDRFENILKQGSDEDDKAYLKPTILPEITAGMRNNVKTVVAAQSKFPQEYIKEYDKFLHLIDGRAEKETEEFIQQPREFEECSEKVKFFDCLGNTILSTLPREVNLGMFELHCEDIIQNLHRKTVILRDQVLKKISFDHQSDNKRLCSEFEEISSTALSSPNNTEELVSLKAKVDEIRTVIMKEKELQLNKAAHRLVFLANYVQFTTAEMKLNTKTFQWHAKMPKVFEEHESIVKEKTAEYQQALKLRRDKFVEELEASNVQVDDFYTYGNVNELSQYMKKAQALNKKLLNCQEKIQQFNMEEEAFEWSQTAYPLWQDTVDKLKPFLGLYETSMAFVNKQKTWFESPMGTHDPLIIDSEVNSSWQLVARLEDEFIDIPSARELVINVRVNIEEFRSKMPVIRTLGNPGFRDRHWENVSNTVGFPVKGGSNLFQILDMGLDEYVSKFEKISEAATKEFNLEKAMEQMVDDWSDMEFTFTSHSDSGTYTLSSMDSIQVLLDDHIVQTQTMQGSPFIKPFEVQIGKWEAQLLLLQEIMDEWLKVQGIWLYLEPIFGSPDIMAQMPEEGRRFTTVDKNWRDIMKAAIVDKHVLKVVEIDKIIEKLKKSNELLDLIGKGLNDYLERKRKCFPRFFFLSNSELLEILSETKDPRRIQQHLKKCFEGIASLDFDEELQVTKMLSATDEVIPLVECISTVKARGQVDLWLCELEIQMRESLKREIQLSLTSYNMSKIQELTQNHPAQALMCSNYVTWTKKVQNSIDGGKTIDKKDLLQENKDFIQMLGDLILQETSCERTKVYANLVLSQGYFSTILEDAVKNEVTTLDDFSWLSRMRYYTEGDRIEIKMMYTKVTYGYEYLQQFTKLVMTPLTERCYQILLMALDLHQGGIVSGETATGKTETIKDLAKAVAKQCVGFNCSEDFHHKAFSKFLKGLASCGAWSCFDEFHRIDSRVLSVIAQQILVIERALQSGQDQINFEGSEIKLNSECALFVTTDSLQQDTRIPDNLKVLFRPVAMVSPDLAMIAEQMLTSYGFTDSKELSQKIACMVDLCDGLLSSQPHYEFGLRSIVSVLRSAGDLKKSEQKEDEHYIISRALQTVKYCELLPQDQRMFKGILEHVFHQCPPDPLPDDVLKKAIIEQCAKNDLEGTPYFLSKVQQLYDMLSLSDGVMLLGDPYGGKTKAWNTLAACLGAADKHAPACIVLNPKAIKIDQLYGYFEKDEWKDGILAKSFRQFASMPKEQHKWLVFDGPVDSEWIESMNTVLDENKKLCLMSGEIIQLPPKTNLIFEAQDVESAAPATITRCGVLYMDPQCLEWNLIVKVWLRNLPQSVTDVTRAKMLTMFDRFCQPLLRLVLKHSGLKTSDHHLISSFLSLFDCYMKENLKFENMSDSEQLSTLEAIFFFSCVWSIGAVCDTDTKAKFDIIFRELLSGDLSADTKGSLNISHDIPLENPYLAPLPKTGSVFDYKLVLNEKQSEWKRWEEDVDMTVPLPREIYACQLIIPNAEQAKYNFVMNLLIENSRPFILLGSPGTGKSVYIRDMLTRKLDVEKFVSVSLYFTSHTNPTATQDIIMSKLDKRRKGVFGPPLGKKFIVFVDDINMPAKDEIGCQPPNELLRQLLDHETWYDNKELSPMRLIDMQVIGTMRPPDGSSNNLTSRFMRHFNMLNVDHLSDDIIKAIFSRIILWHLDTKGFSKEFDPSIDQIVTATLDVHKFVTQNMVPTPFHTHYIFSLKEFSRVVCGVLLSTPDTMADLSAMKRLWVHETMRVYYDRLVYSCDQASFFNAVKKICDSRLQIEFNELNNHLRSTDGEDISENNMRKLLFSDFMDVDSDEKFYREVTDVEELRTASEALLVKYNEVSRKPMDLVLFDFALEHLVRIARVLKQPESHIMLIGVGGSGRQSLSRLASHIAGYEFHDIEMSKEDGLPVWRRILKNVLKKTTLSLSQHVIFISDNLMTDDQFVEDISYILYAGEVPILFNHEDRLEIIENMRSLEQQMPKSVHTDGGGPALLNLFVKRVKENMHIVFAMSPFSDYFRRSIAKFPALLNCCTINWVHQWPNDALSFVSSKFLKDTHFKDNELKKCIELCEFFHSSTISLSKEVRIKHNLFNYVTAASYLELNSLFKSLLEKHRQNVIEKKKMFEASLEKLNGAQDQVTTMQEEMGNLQPDLVEASKELDSHSGLVEKEQAEFTDLEKAMKTHDSAVNDKKNIVAGIQSECDEEFSEAKVLFEGACQVLEDIAQSDIAAVKGAKTPSLSIKLNMEVICIIKALKPERVTDTTGKAADDYWGQSKKLLSDPKFIEILITFDKDNIPAKPMKLIRDKYITNPDMDPEHTKGTNVSMETVARSLYQWVLAIEKHDDLSRAIAPKREGLAKAEADYDKTFEIFNTKKMQLKELQNKLKEMNETVQKKKQRKSDLENEVDLCSRKLERAEQLITGFGGEREKWLKMSNNLETKLNHLTGDILLAAGMIAYLGAFPYEERCTQIKQWKEKADTLEMSYSKDWSLRSVLGNVTTIQSWYMNGLLTDDFSTDNGIMLATAKRWVLMVDPQDIANRWIKTTEKNKNLTILKQSDKEFLRTLETCIQFGSPVLLENVGESLDPALEPLLQKQTFQQGGSTCIKLGESTIEYSSDFRMYITTRLKNPHFPPETTAKIAMVNFSITNAGLVDQLLSIILARERPELEEERSQVSAQLNENKKNLDEIEHKILNVLYSSKGNILEDENAIKNLSGFKIVATEISEKQQVSESAFTRINGSRDEYLDLTDYAVRLFFTGSTLSSINHMYQYSLSWFINLFCSSIDAADKSDELAERLTNVKCHFLQSLFANSIIGLFEEDKIIFSFLLACNLSEGRDDVTGSGLWKLLLNFEDDMETELEEGKAWMSESLKCKMARLQKDECFKGCLKDAADDKGGNFKVMWESEDPETKVPESLDSLRAFDRLVFLIHFRPDKVIVFLRQFISELLGPHYIAQEQMDIGKAYAESVAATPIIFILGKEVDPLKYILRYADEMGFSGKKLKLVTLGLGQEEHAKDVIKRCYRSSVWVVLLNCHLVPHWMDELEYLCDDLSAESTNGDFRLWITSLPHEEFSIPTLQLGVKVALEEPSLVKTNLIRHLFPDKAFATSFNKKSIQYRKLCFAIALFHSAINERSNYAMCGWNQDYIFAETNFDLGLQQLSTVVNSRGGEEGNDSFTMGTLHYLLSNCIYGGCMEDELDMRTLSTFLEVICPDELLNVNCGMDPESIYNTKAWDTHETMMAYLNKLPTEVTSSLMRLSKAHHIMKNEERGRVFIRKLKMIRGLGQGAEADNGGVEGEASYNAEEDRLRAKIVSILESLPELFDLGEDETEILKLVLDQGLYLWSTETKSLYRRKSTIHEMGWEYFLLLNSGVIHNYLI
jgi:dynein heavy chain